MLTNLSIQSLVGAINGNLRCFFRYLQICPATEFYQQDGLIRWRTPVPMAWMNGVLCSRPPWRDEGQTIADTLTYFKARDVPIFSWWLEPHLQVSDWDRHLARRGFRYDRGTPGMAVNLHALPEIARFPAGLEVVTVQDAATLRTWTHTLLAGFGLPVSWEPGLLALLDGLGLDPPVRHYLGYLDGQPVAIASLFLAAGVAGLQYLATVPEVRGRGVATAMALTALGEMRAVGYRAGILQSSEMGYNLYLRLGFRTLCHVGYFYWTR